MPNNSPSDVAVDTSLVLPIIDIGPARAQDLESKRALAAQFDDAFRTSGFCYITNHGIPRHIIDDAFRIAYEFFHLPNDVKAQLTRSDAYGYTGSDVVTATYSDYGADGTGGGTSTTKADLKEIFFLTHDQTKNNWPTSIAPEFEGALYPYFLAVSEVANQVMELIALALGRDEGFFRSKFSQPTTVCNVNYYPPLDEQHLAEGVVSLNEHSDWSVVTLLLQDGVSALEVRERTSNEWIAAPPLPDSIILNVGDLLARWSNDRYVSTPHRVLNVGGKERMSIPVFAMPDPEAIVDPRELGFGDKECLYEPISTGAYLQHRLEESYSEGAS